MKVTLGLLCITVCLVQLTLCQNENSDRPTNALNDEMPTSAIIKGNNSAASANKSWNLSHKVIREMSADVICAMRRRGGISPANLRGLLYNAGVDDAVIDKHRLHAPMPRINNCGLDQSCIERHLILYMS